MNRREVAIADMQCWVFRHAQREWNLSPAECSVVFRKYDLLGFISQCYDSLCDRSYQSVLSEAKEILQSNISQDEKQHYGKETRIRRLEP